MVEQAMDALREEGINKITLIAFRSNRGGNEFWKKAGWDFRPDVNYYEAILNDCNHVECIA